MTEHTTDTDAQEKAEKLSALLNLPVGRVGATIELLSTGNTLPFIARYRKEATGGLDEEEIRAIEGALEALTALDERRKTVLASIEEQGKLTADLKAQICAAETRTALEDLYQPYRPKRRTRAGLAREKGLQPLADLILAQPRFDALPVQLARPFITDLTPTIEDALAGARDIVAETISDHPTVRRLTREKAMRFGVQRTQLIDGAGDPRGVYELYYDFSLPVNRLRPHQILAINRGEAQKVLRVGFDVQERDWRQAMASAFQSDRLSPLADELEAAINDAAARLLLPAIERDVRRSLTERAEEQAIRVFAANLRGLLSQPPLAGRTVLALDPGYRTGCKIAVVDPTGKLLDTATIYPHPPQRQHHQSLDVLATLVDRYAVTLIAIGNGTASRESEELAADLIQARTSADSGAGAGTEGLHYIMVNEAGASVYSASPLARAELSELDVSLRSSVSIARRVQDPLAELVKIDPKSIGVGMYQHDVNQKMLAASLDGVVESVVNQVGVDVNTASPALLTHVAGIGAKLAKRIVAHRDQLGPFFNRRQLKDVPGLGPKAFEQSAGFLRVRNGDNPLDESAIHPESYRAARAVMARANLTVHSTSEERVAALDTLAEQSVPALALELGIGEPTLIDILEQLVRPGRDPREDLPAPILRSDVLSMDDLYPGLVLQGTVRNVVDFGAFVDLGVKQDGLLHRSQIPRSVTPSVGDVIDIEILKVEKERGRIGLGWPGNETEIDWAVG